MGVQSFNYITINKHVQYVCVNEQLLVSMVCVNN